MNFSWSRHELYTRPDLEFEKAHAVGILPGLTGKPDGGVDEEDALGDICKKAVPSLKVTEPETEISDMAQMIATSQ